MVNYTEHPKPQFRISLTKDQVTELGRLSVIWGQLDHFTMMTVTKLLAVDQHSGAILMKEMTTGPLVGLLRKSLPRIKNSDTRKKATNFCADMSPLIEYRNHIMHGIWGWQVKGKNARKAKPACLYLKEPKRELRPDRITITADRAAEQTHVINSIMCSLYGVPTPGPNDPYPRFFFTMESVDDLELPKGLGLQSL